MYYIVYNDENISIEWKYLTPWIACGVNLIFVITGGFGLYSNSKTATNNIGIITIILNVECVCATPLVIGLCCIGNFINYIHILLSVMRS